MCTSSGNIGRNTILLAMVVNENACLLAKRGVLQSIASRLAPTLSRGIQGRLTPRWRRISRSRSSPA
ncbi:hypothetical protein EI969_09565 [Pseudomonas sp. PB101]|nr:hypothetical protein [Pseudomonas sp. PB101]